MAAAGPGHSPYPIGAVQLFSMLGVVSYSLASDINAKARANGGVGYSRIDRRN